MRYSEAGYEISCLWGSAYKMSLTANLPSHLSLINSKTILFKMMEWRKSFFTFLIIVTVLMLIILWRELPKWQSPRMNVTSMACFVPESEMKMQRDFLSKELNLLKQVVGIWSCESGMGNVGVYGGWCKNVSHPQGGEHVFDSSLADAMLTILKGKKVASFGEGPGDYKNYIVENTEVVIFDAYDGSPYCEEVSNGTVKFLDLTSPQFGLPVYDWIICLEVAEHIPVQFESIFLDNLFRHAQEGIILSWATPEQPGLGHVNGRTLYDVQLMMLKNGFSEERDQGRKLRDAASQVWLRKNVYVYKRISKDPLCIKNS